MLSASAQLRHVEQRLLLTGGLLRPDVQARITALDQWGDFAATLDFPDGHQLRVRMFIDTRHEYPLWVRYAFLGALCISLAGSERDLYLPLRQ